MSLEDLRKRIDEVDSQLVQLLNERAQVVVEVGKIKKETGIAPVYAPEREKMVLDRICAMNAGPLLDKTLVAVWRELMSGSFALERCLRIAYLGPQGSYTHSAALLQFGQSVDYEAMADIRSIFDEVSKGHCDLGVVPVENSSGGGVIETLDAFVDTDVVICAELYMSIHHNLLSNCRLEEIEKIYSKPEAFAQCRKWLASTFKDARTIPTASTAKAAQLAAAEPGAAAIGSKVAAKLYGLGVLLEDIEDESNNVTRFMVISKQDAKPSGDDKTAIMFCTADKSGALVDVLNVLQAHGVNMTRIESRPSRKRQWEYFFFAEVQGHRQDSKIVSALAEAKKHCLQLSVLGSFPRNINML